MDLRQFLSQCSNQKGVTFIEVIIATLLLTFFVSGYFWLFVDSKKVSRIADVKINATAVAGNALEMMKQEQGARGYFSTTLDNGTHTFGSESSLRNLDTSIGHNIPLTKKEYQVTTFNNNSRSTRKDGFKKVTVTLEYQDPAQNLGI